MHLNCIKSVLVALLDSSSIPYILFCFIDLHALVGDNFFGKRNIIQFDFKCRNLRYVILTLSYFYDVVSL